MQMFSGVGTGSKNKLNRRWYGEPTPMAVTQTVKTVCFYIPWYFGQTGSPPWPPHPAGVGCVTHSHGISHAALCL